MIGQLVPRDPAEPRDHIGASIERGAAVDGGDERLLAELLGEGGIATAAAEEVRVDARERPSVPRLEGGVVRERQLELVRRLGGPGASGHVPRVRSFDLPLAYEQWAEQGDLAIVVDETPALVVGVEDGV